MQKFTLTYSFVRIMKSVLSVHNKKEKRKRSRDQNCSYLKINNCLFITPPSDSLT